jgi:hypothetical protein
MGRPLRAVLAALCSYGVLLLCIIEFPLSAGFLLLIGFSVPCLLSNFFTRTILRPFTPEPTPVLEPEPDLSISPGECSEDI